MIRAASLALALAAGGAAAEAPATGEGLVALCGGLRVTVTLGDPGQIAQAEAVLNRRAGPFPALIDYVTADGAALTVHLPAALAGDARLRALTETGDVLIAPAEEVDGPGEGVLPGPDGTHYRLTGTPLVVSGQFEEARASLDPSGGPAVSFRFDAAGARAFGDWTTRNVGGVLAIVYDGAVLTAPRIMTPITGGSGIISGMDTMDAAEVTAIALRSGALPVDLAVTSVEEVPAPAGPPDPVCGAAAQN